MFGRGLVGLRVRLLPDKQKQMKSAIFKFCCKGLLAYYDEIGDCLCVFRPQIARGMFVVCGSCFEPYERQSLLGVGSDADSGADIFKGGRCFIDLDVDVGVFKEGEGGAEATDAAADDCDM